ncbi:hypothetical protein [Klenkia brasiliensis]|uniref:Uncharacterized protein n=1 Tax=Klenkia brasiliensis TaxID=333142 RepID=A0A1G7QHY5_9ACTN|nr:hypothetical protein [Klenkia brasiliensis]SDF98121.1 hypothetical protein SAMN05660324_1491 [Klenkia brasiliensis]
MTVVLPVGFRLGPETVPAAVAGSVRLGWARHALDEDEARVWDLAHGLAGDDPLCGHDLLLAHAAAVGVAEPEAVVARLAGRSLLVHVPPSADDLADLARRLVARPLLVGIGAGRDPSTRALGLPGWPVLELPLATALRWESTGTAADLQEAAELAAGALGDPAAVRAALADVVGDLPVLLSHHCGYLDLADPRG